MDQIGPEATDDGASFGSKPPDRAGVSTVERCVKGKAVDRDAVQGRHLRQRPLGILIGHDGKLDPSLPEPVEELHGEDLRAPDRRPESAAPEEDAHRAKPMAGHPRPSNPAVALTGRARNGRLIGGGSHDEIRPQR
jgi:hypothetical protein